MKKTWAMLLIISVCSTPLDSSRGVLNSTAPHRLTPAQVQFGVAWFFSVGARMARGGWRYFISYPRSGRAWFLTIILHLRRNGFAADGIRHHHNDSSDHTIGRYNPNKKHWKDTNRRIVILTRDPRDVVVSHWHILKHRTKRFKKKWGDMSLFEWIQQPVGLPFVCRFLNDWIRDEYNEKCFISYEGLHKDGPSEVERALRHWGIPINGDLRVVDEVNVDMVRRRFAHSNSDTNPDAHAARRGESGVWWEYFSPEECLWIDEYIFNHLDPRYTAYHR